jgi:histidine phosphotransferase ChpT
MAARLTAQAAFPSSGQEVDLPDPSLDFASLLCSRLCHDLMSPVGAVGNGLELLADERDEDMRARCMELVADSAQASADKLKFFRLAFGAAGGSGDDLAAGEVRLAMEGLVRGNKRVTLGWLVEAPSLGRLPAKLLLNLALLAFDALVRGGQLDVGVEGPEVVVRAEGPKLVLDAEIRAILRGEAAAVTARTAPAWLVRQLVEAAGGQLMLADAEPGMLLLAALLPG